MKPFNRIAMFIVVMSLVCISPAQDKTSKKTPDQKTRQVWIKLKSGPIVTGDLVQMDPNSVDFKVKGILQSVPCDDILGAMFIPPTPRPTPAPTPTPTPTPIPTPSPLPSSESIIYPMTAELRPQIFHRDKAAYTRIAVEAKIQGTVVLQVVFHESGKITDIKVIRPLSHGLTEQAIGTAYMTRFNPAMKDGKPVSVRGTIECTFNLY